MLNFTLHKKDGYARRATVELNHGKIEPPCSCPWAHTARSKL